MYSLLVYTRSWWCRVTQYSIPHPFILNVHLCCCCCSCCVCLGLLLEAAENQPRYRSVKVSRPLFLPSGTDPISLLILLLLVRPSLKKAKDSVVSNRIGMKLGRIVLQVNTHRSTESDFWCDFIIISTWHQRRHLTQKVLPSGKCTRYAAASVSSW